MTITSEPLYSRNTTQWCIAGTKTYRLGSRAVLSQWGGNTQNIEKGMREIYEADDDKLLVQCDQSGAEALIVAHLMPPGNTLLQLFENKIKIHNYMAVIFPEIWKDEFPEVYDFRHIPIPELKLQPRFGEFVKAVAATDNNPPPTRYYYHYKMTGHSGNYGVRAATFIDNIMLKSGGQMRLTRNQGEKLIEGYHTLIPTIRGSFHKYIAEMYVKHGTIWNLQGYPITITQKVREDEYNKIYDKCPQSTVGCITHIAYIALQQYIEQEHRDWDLLGNCHDSYLAQAPVGEEVELAKKMKEFMEQSLVGRYGEVFKMRSEVQCGKNWSPFKKDKNEEGLREISI